MKCRYTIGNYSVVIATSRRGVANLGAILQDNPDVSLFALCTESCNGDRLWTTLWYRKPNRSIQFVSDIRGLPYVLQCDIANVRFDLLSDEPRVGKTAEEYRSFEAMVRSYESANGPHQV